MSLRNRTTQSVEKIFNSSSRILFISSDIFNTKIQKEKDSWQGLI